MSGKSASAGTKSSREAKLEQIRRQNAAEARRNRILVGITVAVVVAIVGVVVGVIVVAARQDSAVAGSTPTGMSTVEGGGGSVEAVVNASTSGESTATLTVFEDFMCPICGQFEAAYGAWIEGLPAQGVDVAYAPISILDRFSNGTEFSSRSAGAAACLAEDGPETFMAWKDLMFAGQPEEGSDGLTDEVMADYAAQAGASDAVQQCILDGTYKSWAARQSEDSLAAGVTGTPSVWVNGERIGEEGSVATQEEIIAALAEAGVEVSADVVTDEATSEATAEPTAADVPASTEPSTAAS